MHAYVTRQVDVTGDAWQTLPLPSIDTPAGAASVAFWLRRLAGGTDPVFVSRIRVERETAAEARARARIDTVEATRVDSAGAVAAVTQTISAEYADLGALAEATAFAQAGLDAITSGFLFRVNQAGDGLEIVNVGTPDGDVSTLKIATDFVRIGGLTQIDTAVIETLAADSAFLGALEVDTLQIKGGAVTIPVSAQQGIPATMTSETWVPILMLAINREGYSTRISFSAQVDANGGGRGLAAQEAAIARTRLKRGGTVIAGPLTTTTAKYGHQVSMAWNVTDTDLGAGVTFYAVEASKVELGTHYLHPRIFAADLSAQEFKR